MFSKSKSTGRNQIVLMNPAATTTTTTTATTTAVAATAIELPILLQFLVPLLFFLFRLLALVLLLWCYCSCYSCCHHCFLVFLLLILYGYYLFSYYSCIVRVLSVYEQCMLGLLVLFLLHSHGHSLCSLVFSCNVIISPASALPR